MEAMVVATGVEPTNLLTASEILAVTAGPDASRSVPLRWFANDVPGYRRIVREVREAVSEWASFAAGSELDEETIKSIETEIEHFAPR
ncbi:MAG TPA: hypothetical protein VK283_01020 [Acidimicrobiales bacterium]|nr:hypothetical protein [Acidimicrobiales bacterium]